MALLERIAIGAAGNAFARIAKQIARDKKNFREGYLAALADIKAGKKPRFT